MTTINLILSHNVTESIQHLIIMFVDNWVTSIIPDDKYTIRIHPHYITITTANNEDATALCLIGVPKELSKFIELSTNDITA